MYVRTCVSGVCASECVGVTSRKMSKRGHVSARVSGRRVHECRPGGAFSGMCDFARGNASRSASTRLVVTNGCRCLDGWHASRAKQRLAPSLVVTLLATVAALTHLPHGLVGVGDSPNAAGQCTRVGWCCCSVGASHCVCLAAVRVTHDVGKGDVGRGHRVINGSRYRRLARLLVVPLLAAIGTLPRLCNGVGDSPDVVDG
jgi:hypothetical protein